MTNRSSDEPARISPDSATSAKMARLARRDTAPEWKLRRQLHALGLRYNLQVPVPGTPRRSIDIAFPRLRIAVFVDGCYWHGCPEHGTRPRTNSEWWDWKIERTRMRDQDTNKLLSDRDWNVIRIWEHEDAHDAALRIESVVRRRN